MGISRRIYRQGNSAVVSVPRWMWGQIGADLGDRVEIEGVPGRMLTITLLEKGVVPERKNQIASERQKEGRE